MPHKPVTKPVKFKSVQGGVFLDFLNARTLAERELKWRAYIKQLETRIEENNRMAEAN